MLGSAPASAKGRTITAAVDAPPTAASAAPRYEPSRQAASARIGASRIACGFVSSAIAKAAPASIGHPSCSSTSIPIAGSIISGSR